MQTFNKKKVSNDSATEIAPENVDWLYVYVQAFIELLPLFLLLIQNCRCRIHSTFYSESDISIQSLVVVVFLRALFCADVFKSFMAFLKQNLQLCKTINFIFHEKSIIWG